MTRSTKEIFRAACAIIEELIQTEEVVATDREQEHVRAIVEYYCAEWEPSDKKNAVQLAWLVTGRTGDNWEWADHRAGGDRICGAAFADLRISHALQVYAGVQSPLRAEERDDAIRTRQKYPDPRRYVQKADA